MAIELVCMCKVVLICWNRILIIVLIHLNSSLAYYSSNIWLISSLLYAKIIQLIKISITVSLAYATGT